MRAIVHDFIRNIITRSASRPQAHARAARRFMAALLVLCAPLLCGPAQASSATLAVAANFMPAAAALVRAFEANDAARLRLVSGSTGKLYAQIVNGAPYDLFLAADAARPQLLEQQGHVVAGSRFTYAHGQLVLVAARQSSAHPRALLISGAYRRLALANPKLAPYGLAAQQVLTELGLWHGRERQRVVAENVGQVWAMFATGNVELAFVARSQLRESRLDTTHWSVPSHMHAPIRQDAVQLRRAANNDAASGFMRFLRSSTARAVIEQAGYQLPEA